MFIYKHIPVLLKEVMHFLNIKQDGYYIDATLGGASYTKAITESLGDKGRLLSLDLDPLAIDNFKKFKTKKNIVVNDNFSNLAKVVKDNFDKNVLFDAIVADLGLSSAQLDDVERGFSFNNEKSLDMSFGPKIDRDTSYIVNNYNFDDLEKVLAVYGDESWSKKIALDLVNYRKKHKIENAKELAEIIAQSIPKKFWSNRIHPATKSFQALRIETNQEMNNLQLFLQASCDLLKPSGSLVIVSFHSLEDRIVKLFFKEKSRPYKSADFEIITKKPLIPSLEEIHNNPRSRSAKLRVLRRKVK